MLELVFEGIERNNKMFAEDIQLKLVLVNSHITELLVADYMSKVYINWCNQNRLPFSKGGRLAVIHLSCS